MFLIIHYLSGEKPKVKVQYLVRSIFIPNCILQISYHSFNLSNFIHSLFQIGLQLSEVKIRVVFCRGKEKIELNISVKIFRAFLSKKLPGGFFCLRNPVSERLLYTVSLLPKILASVGQGAPNDPPQPDACFPLLLRQPDVVVRECLPISRKALCHIVQSLARLALDISSVVFQVYTS